MKTSFFFLVLFCVSVASAEIADVNAMILTGQASRYHNWRETSRTLKKHLNASGRFTVDTVVAPQQGDDLSSFRPEFSSYDVVIVIYEGDDWPASTREAFVGYVKNGGGVVAVHATCNAFKTWEEWTRMLGIGNWSGSMYHPPKHDFPITIRNPGHPITRGLPQTWLHAYDECYSGLRGPAENLTVLATGYADPSLKQASKKHEPVLMTIRYGKGRVFHTTLGHVGAKEHEPAKSIRCVGFLTTFTRGAEWAGTGRVTIPVPDDFPTAGETSVREN